MAAGSDRMMVQQNVKRFQRTPEYVKARAMQLYGEYGLEEASRRMGVDKTTMNRWRKELGIPSKKMMPVTVEDVDKALREQDMLRLDMQALLLNKSRLLLHLMTEDKKADELHNLSRAVENLIGVYRLEQGQATSRSESNVVEQEFSERERAVMLRNISAELASRVRRATPADADGSADAVLEGSAKEPLQLVSGQAD